MDVQIDDAEDGHKANRALPGDFLPSVAIRR